MQVQNISSLDAYYELDRLENRILIDVRSSSEWIEAGIPKLERSKLLLLSIYLSPNMLPNQEFINQCLTQIRNYSFELFFLCRSGRRSLEAANLLVNYVNNDCYNIVDGFSGNGSALGWKNNNLPWQSL